MTLSRFCGCPFSTQELLDVELALFIVCHTRHFRHMVPLARCAGGGFPAGSMRDERGFGST